MNRSILPVLLVFVALISVSVAQPATASTSVNGKLSIALTEVVAGTPLRIDCSNLDASTTYYVNITVDSTTTQYGPWVTSSEANDFSFTWEAEKPATGYSVLIELCSPAGSAIDSQTMTINAIDDVLPTNLLITLGISLLVIAIVVRILQKK